MTIAIIGAGRVGGALASRSAEHGAPCPLITRERGWEALDVEAGAPILVAVRNDDLAAVFERTPEHRRQDLVLVQNGMLRPWIAERGLDEATRGLLFFAVPKRGAPVDPGGFSPFTGPHAAAVVAWLSALDLPAEVVTSSRFAELELEKLIWNCAFGLLCQVHDAPVGEVVSLHGDELRSLVAEMTRVGAVAMGADLELDPLVERLCAYSRSIADYQGAVKEWRWRNGWFVDAAGEHRIATPVHTELLRRAGL